MSEYNTTTEKNLVFSKISVLSVSTFFSIFICIFFMSFFIKKTSNISAKTSIIPAIIVFCVTKKESFPKKIDRIKPIINDRTIKADFIFFFCLFINILGRTKDKRISSINKIIKKIPFALGSFNFLND